MASHEKLFTAIYTRATGGDAAAFLALSTGGFHAHPAPEGTAYPFTTWTVPASGSGLGTMTSDHDEVLVQFSIWDRSNSPLTVLKIRDALVALFNRQEAAMSVSPDNMVSVEVRSPGRAMKDAEPGVYVCHVDIAFRVG